MTFNNPPKAFLLLVAMLCVTVLLAIGAIDQSTGTAMIGSALGYIIGNGVAAKKGEPVEPVFKKADE